MNIRLYFSVALTFLFLLVSVSFSIAGEPHVVSFLQKGGFNLYIRHVGTDWSQSDKIQQKGDIESCDPKKVRQLSDKGREDARTIGKALKFFKIKVGKILSSPYCRAVETASLMGIGKVEKTTELMNMRSADLFGGDTAVIERARKLLSVTPPKGTNTLLSAHGNLARAATSVYPDEGEILVFFPLPNGKFEFIDRISPAQWRKLMQDPNIK